MPCPQTGTSPKGSTNAEVSKLICSSTLFIQFLTSQFSLQYSSTLKIHFTSCLPNTLSLNPALIHSSQVQTISRVPCLKPLNDPTIHSLHCHTHTHTKTVIHIFITFIFTSWHHHMHLLISSFPPSFLVIAALHSMPMYLMHTTSWEDNAASHTPMLTFSYPHAHTSSSNATITCLPLTAFSSHLNNSRVTCRRWGGRGWWGCEEGLHPGHNTWGDASCLHLQPGLHHLARKHDRVTRAEREKGVMWPSGRCWIITNNTGDFFFPARDSLPLQKRGGGGRKVLLQQNETE